MPEQMVPMRVCREAGDHRLAQLAKVIREADELIDGHPGVDEQHTTLTAYHNRICLYELAAMDKHTVGHMLQHQASFRL